MSSKIPNTLKDCIDWLCILQINANEANVALKEALEAVAANFEQHKPDLAAAIKAKAKADDEILILRKKVQAKLDVIDEVEQA